MTLDISTTPSYQMSPLYSLLCMLKESDLSLPWLGSSVQTCCTCQSAQSSSASVWRAAALCLPALSLQDKLTTLPLPAGAPLTLKWLTLPAHTCRHAQAHIHIRSERATHLLIPFSLIPHHSPQIFPSADLIVRECVCVCILVVVLAGLVQQDLLQMPGFSLVEHYQFSAYAHLHQSWGELNLKHQLCSSGGCDARHTAQDFFSSVLNEG